MPPGTISERMIGLLSPRSACASPSTSSTHTIRHPSTGDFQTDVRTVLPFHVTSRGSPTFTESTRGMRTSSQSSVRLGSFLFLLYFLPTTSRSGTIHMEYLSAHMGRLCQVKHRIDDILDRGLFHSRLKSRVAGIILVHRRIHFAGGYGIKANAVFCILNCQILCCCIQATLRNHRNRAIYARNWPIGKRRSDAHNASRFLFQHLFHGALSDVEESKQISGDKSIDVLGSEVSERLF